MLQINERPNITSAISTEDGYRVRNLCLVDGFPAEIDIQVDTHRQKYSQFTIQIYDPINGRWGATVADLKSEEVGRMPILHDEAETLAELNRVAALLWEMANLIVRTARLRQEDLDTDDYVRNRLALAEAKRLRDEQDEIQISNADLSRIIRHDAGIDPFASGSHDDAEFAADASDEERQG